MAQTRINRRQSALLISASFLIRFVIERLTDLEETRTAIKDMHVRGAGLIGATAGFGMYLAAVHASEKNFDQEMVQAGSKTLQQPADSQKPRLGG